MNYTFVNVYCYYNYFSDCNEFNVELMTDLLHILKQVGNNNTVYMYTCTCVN